MTNDIRIEFAARTDTGRVRQQNEDCVAIVPSHGIAVLADGMGGYSAGEIASSMAIEVVRAVLERAPALREGCHETQPHVSHRPIAQLLDNAIQAANTAILEAARTEPGLAGMGTTIVVAVLRSDTITIAHVGDSRAYRLRKGELLQLTRDHSLLQEQIDAGLIHPDWARFAQNKNLVTRAVGVSADMKVDVSDHHTQPGDIYLLCSDGLSDMLTFDEILTILSLRSATLQTTCDALVQRANENGGHDNISVILITEQSTQGGERSLVERIRKWIL